MTIKAVIRSSGWAPFGVTGVLIRRRGFVIKCMPNSPAGRDPLAKAVLQAMPCEFYDAAWRAPSRNTPPTMSNTTRQDS
jgi:hypothetical protein